MAPERNEDEVGALWERVSKNGETYMTGTVGDQKVVVFKVREKKNDAQPDWRILKSKPREQP